MGREGTSAGGGLLSSGLILILIVAAAYLAAHALSEWLARRFLVVSGAEYLILGILLGPYVTSFIRTSPVESFAPFLTLALGWTGAQIGTWFYLPKLVRTRGIIFNVAFFEAIIALVFIAGVMGFAFAMLFNYTLEQTLRPAIALGAIAVASSPRGVEVLANRLSRRGAIVRQIETTASIDALVAITAFSLMLCFRHVAPLGISRAPTATEWAVISIGIGFVGGALFHLFLGRERQVDRLFIGMAGAIILASGTAAYLRLSPLLPTMIIGAILVNTSRNRDVITTLLSGVSRPLYFVLLLFAGAAWQPATRTAWLLPVVLFIFVRVAGKVGSARLAARLNRRYRALGPNWGVALLGQGSVAVAIAVNYLMLDVSLLPNVVFTAAIVSVLLTDFMGGYLTRFVVEDHLRRLTSRLGDVISRTISFEGKP